VLRGLERLDREIIKPLAVWDTGVRYTSVLQPGIVLSGCRILRNDASGAEPYVVEFDSAGHRYSCPLFAFQPRTQAVAAAPELQPVAGVLAV
jgi:hypothetical protein